MRIQISALKGLVQEKSTLRMGALPPATSCVTTDRPYCSFGSRKSAKGSMSARTGVLLTMQS